MKFMGVSHHAAALVVFFVSAAHRAGAVPMTFDLQGDGDADLTASVLFSYDPGTFTISVDITNTSLLAAGPDPRLTGFAFNVPSGVTGVTSFTGPSGWDDLFDPDDINTPGQFGFFDLAGVTGPNFNGGSPNDGIARGVTRSFTFLLSGSGLGLLSEGSFLGLPSFDPPGNPDEDDDYFIARFQRTGADEQGSDVALPAGLPEPVPEPTSLLLLGSGLSGFWFARRKKRSSLQN